MPKIKIGPAVDDQVEPIRGDLREIAETQICAGRAFVELENGNHGAGGKVPVMKRRAFPPQRPAFRLFPDVRRVERESEIASEFTFDDPGGLHSMQPAMIQFHRFSSFARYSSKNCISASWPMPWRSS